MYEGLKISDRCTTAAAPHSVVSQCVVQTTFCERSSCCWERISEKHPRTPFKSLWKCLIDRSTVGCWVKRVMASETGKAEFHAMPHWGCLVTTVNPEILQHADTIVCDDWWITTWQLALHLSISKGSVSHTIWDIGYLKVWMWWVFQSLTVEQKTQKKFIYSELLACFEPRLLQQMKPGSLMDWAQRTNPWNGSILILPGKKIEKVSVTGWGHDHCLLALWRCDSCDCDA